MIKIDPPNFVVQGLILLAIVCDWRHRKHEAVIVYEKDRWTIEHHRNENIEYNDDDYRVA